MHILVITKGGILESGLTLVHVLILRLSKECQVST